MTVEEQIALYAIGALEREEAAALEKQLAADPALRVRLAQARAAAAAWTQAAEPVAPSPRVKQQLLHRIDASRAPAISSTSSTTTPIARRPIPQKAGWREMLVWLFGGLSIVAAATAIVFGVSLAGTQNNLAQVQSQMAHMQSTAQTAQMQAQVDAQQAQSELAQARGELAVLLQPNAITARVPANKPDYEDGAISVTFAPNTRQALVSVANLPPLQADQTYQVWLIKDGVPLPSSVFNTDADGQGRLIVTSDEPFSTYQSFGITVEPAGGRPTPNPDGPIFLGRLS